MAFIEKWMPVLGHELEYEVSNFGQIRSIDREIKQISRWGGEYTRKFKGKLLRPGPMNFGHLTVAIGKGNSRTVHSLVLEAFVGPCPPGLECRHLDGIKTHNWLVNLAWGTRSENCYDRWNHARSSHN